MTYESLRDNQSNQRTIGPKSSNGKKIFFAKLYCQTAISLEIMISRQGWFSTIYGSPMSVESLHGESADDF